jgi:hypothetical protein
MLTPLNPVHVIITSSICRASSHHYGSLSLFFICPLKKGIVTSIPRTKYHRPQAMKKERDGEKKKKKKRKKESGEAKEELNV